MITEQNLSYQIIVNSYLREHKPTWVKHSTSQLKGDLKQCPHTQAFNTVNEIVNIKCEKTNYEILVAIKYWSATERHQFNFPLLCRPSSASKWEPLELSRFLVITMSDYGAGSHRGRGDLDKLIYRCLQSKFNTDNFIKQRQDELDSLHSAKPQSFIRSEQALVVGHQLHPTAKSREGFSSSEIVDYSPETQGSFQLHYFSAHSSYLHQDSAESSSAQNLVKQELGRQLENSRDLPKGLDNIFSDPEQGLVPVHPWQADYLRQQKQVRELEQQGKLRYWGALGENYYATTSIRTVFNPNSNYMYKLSLNVRITNSERVNKSWELDRVVETARMLQLPIASLVKKSAENFTIVKEPAYISIKARDSVLDGFSCILRDNTDFKSSHRDISSITSLVQDHPFSGKNRLFNIVKAIADRENKNLQDVAINWFERYFEVSIESLMRLFLDWGLCFEPHGQNTLIEMQDGYPSHCFCRDGQGFFHREASHEDWCRVIPNKGEATESIFPEELAKERLIYYPFINQLFSVINAFGTQGLVDEITLLKISMQRLKKINEKSAPYPFTLLEVLEEANSLPCKANLLTQLYDMDELVGDIATQSVYVRINNSMKTAAFEQ